MARYDAVWCGMVQFLKKFKVFSLHFIDCIHILVTSESFATSQHFLLLSEVLWCLRDIMDLSLYCPTESTPRKLVFDELCRAMPGKESYITSELLKNQNKPGSLGLEIPHTGKYFAIPSHIVIVREKCYYIQVLFQMDASSTCQFTQKIAARGSIPKVRCAKFSLTDFEKISDSKKIEYVTGLGGLRSKNFVLYEIEYKRRHVTKFTKKRFMTLSGESFPFHFFLNDSLEFNEFDSALPIPKKLQELSI